MNRKQRILIVDDDPMARRFLASILLESYDVTVCESVEQVEGFLKGQDLVLLDQKPGNLSGSNLTRIAIGRGIRVPIILMSSTNIALLKNGALIEQVKGYLQKPFDEETLMAEVVRVLNLKRILGLKVFIAEADMVGAAFT